MSRQNRSSQHRDIDVPGDGSAGIEGDQGGAELGERAQAVVGNIDRGGVGQGDGDAVPPRFESEPRVGGPPKGPTLASIVQSVGAGGITGAVLFDPASGQVLDQDEEEREGEEKEAAEMVGRDLEAEAEGDHAQSENRPAEREPLTVEEMKGVLAHEDGQDELQVHGEGT